MWEASRSSSLLATGLDAVSLNSAWSSLSAGCSNYMIVDLVSDVLSLSLCGSGLCILDALWHR